MVNNSHQSEQKSDRCRTNADFYESEKLLTVKHKQSPANFAHFNHHKDDIHDGFNVQKYSNPADQHHLGSITGNRWIARHILVDKPVCDEVGSNIGDSHFKKPDGTVVDGGATNPKGAKINHEAGYQVSSEVAANLLTGGERLAGLNPA